MSLFIGIDTSNYTTSVASIGDTQISLRKIIDVKEGMRGIRQSDGVFVHLKELPRLFEKLDIDMKSVEAVGVSTRPRSVDGSYMPVFVAGESFARVIAKSLSVPVFEFSHQDGHIMAGIISAKCENLLDMPFCAVHMSGGTTEILECAYNGRNFSVNIIGGTKDISAGQLVDRLGVKLGMKFPCGKEFDKLSLSAQKEIALKISVSDGYFNLSGMETKLIEMAGHEDSAVLARSALVFLAKSITDAVNFNSYKDVLFVGGVSANTIMRDYFTHNIKKNVYFASPELSSDNALGIAELTRRASLR